MEQTRECQDAVLRDIYDRIRKVLASSEDYLERMHHCAVDMQRDGKLEGAAQLYRHIRSCPGSPLGLQAWTWYKEGEIHRQAGNEIAARECLGHALEASPRHVKARLLLHPADAPLVVCFGLTRKWLPETGYQLSFPYHNLDTWSYYLGTRSADELWVTPPLKVLEFDLRTLKTILERFVAVNGRVVFAISTERKLCMPRAELSDMLSEQAASFRARFQRLMVHELL